jgi:hypothetical protein
MIFVAQSHADDQLEWIGGNFNSEKFLLDDVN